MDPLSPQNLPSPENTEQSGSGEKNTGSIIGIIIIVLVLALGGLYFWGKRVAEKDNNPNNTNLPRE
ncbi:MAG: hypothetical protein HYY60_01320 [Parcubacteria group bacterium]|nr:hypothetical protein [Candidatus Liptonbacteria bacterium]MBI3019948.1 hypothetical protein [Parcubacteria group bacterium]MBI3075199.1 hypothetical protein [Parcubacteria group bacterium]